ncbi:MAG TPA: zinc ribbon domain-containing protein, partial [Ktedonobacteraceae bacterium]|nr:zinc ribbon domain-containing protein [Ktedonobacteraceae bacterium]
MAVLCSHCGKALLKEDARFCNNCGMLVASHPFSPQSLAAKKESLASSVPPAVLPAPAPVEPEQPAIREQIAQQPPSRLAQHAVRDELPDWVNTPEKEQPPQDVADLSDTPTRLLGKEHVEKALSTMHELRVKVWEQKETISMIAVPETPALVKKLSLTDEETIEKFPTSQLAAASVEEITEEQLEEAPVEDRPTQLMEVPPSAHASTLNPAKEPTAQPHNPALETFAPRQATPLPPVSPEIASQPMDAQRMRESYLDEMERLDTLDLPAQSPAKFVPPVPVQPQPAPA